MKEWSQMHRFTTQHRGICAPFAFHESVKRSSRTCSTPFDKHEADHSMVYPTGMVHCLLEEDPGAWGTFFAGLATPGLAA